MIPCAISVTLHKNKIPDLVTFTEEILNGKLHFLCSVTICDSIINRVLLQHYKTLVGELYIELKDEKIMGIFLSDPEVNAINASPFIYVRKKRTKIIPNLRSKDIEQMLTGIENPRKRINTVSIK